MSSLIQSLETAQLRTVPKFDSGDRVKVHFQVVEGTRKRTQVFEGIVIKRQGAGARETFTVRKQSFGVGVERTFPVHSPKIEQIEVAAFGEVRRAKLYYLRDRVGKRARVRERAWGGPEQGGGAPKPMDASVEGGLDAEGGSLDEVVGEAAPIESTDTSGKTPRKGVATDGSKDEQAAQVETDDGADAKAQSEVAESDADDKDADDKTEGDTEVSAEVPNEVEPPVAEEPAPEKTES